MDDDLAEDVFNDILKIGRYGNIARFKTKHTNCAITLCALGYLDNPYENKDIYIPTDLGKMVLLFGGWKSYKEKQSSQEKLTSEKANYDLKIAKFNAKFGWLSLIVSIVAIIISIITLCLQ